MLEKQLNELSIYALREAARRSGVASPTTKKKEQLIREIIAVKSGKQKPELTKTRQGRPPKGVNYNLNMLDYGFGSDSKTITLKQNSQTFTAGEIKTVSGYVELLKDGSTLLWSFVNTTQMAYFIPQQVVGNYELRQGDLLVCEAMSTLDTNVVQEILNINGCPIKKYKNTRKDYFAIESILPNKNIEFATEGYSDFNLKYGESIYVYGISNNEKTQAVINLLNNIKSDEKIYVNISVAEKNKMHLKDLENTESFIGNITDELTVVRKTVTLAIERVKRAFENGKSVVLVIDDVLSVMGNDDEFKTQTKKIMSLSKNSKTGSITTIAIMQGNPSEALFERLVDKRLLVENSKIKII